MWLGILTSWRSQSSSLVIVHFLYLCLNLFIQNFEPFPATHDDYLGFGMNWKLDPSKHFIPCRYIPVCIDNKNRLKSVFKHFHVNVSDKISAVKRLWVRETSQMMKNNKSIIKTVDRNSTYRNCHISLKATNMMPTGLLAVLDGMAQNGHKIQQWMVRSVVTDWVVLAPLSPTQSAAKPQSDRLQVLSLYWNF